MKINNGHTHGYGEPCTNACPKWHGLFPPVTGDTLTDTERESLVVALYESKIGEYGYLGRPECEQFAAPLIPAVERILADRRTGEADLRARIETLADESPRCWMTKNDDLTCGEMAGGTFPNGAVFTEAACCLPCRLRAALATDPKMQAPDITG